MYADDWKADISNEITKLFLESYFDIVMCALLALLSFLERDENGYIKFASFFSTFTDFWCTSLSLLHMFLIIFFPGLSFYRIYLNFDRIKNNKAAKKEFSE